MLTIAIPTYNRKDAILGNVTSLINSNVNKRYKILIIDNASPDGTYERLSKFSSAPNVKILKNEYNLGVTGNFIELIKECDTDYMLLTSDEDQVITENLEDLENFLRTFNPNFVATQFFLKRNKILVFYRGAKKTREIKPKEIWDSAFYFSGLVFKMDSSKRIIDDMEYWFKAKDNIYSQLVLIAKLMIEAPCYFWAKPITFKVFDLPQQTTNVKGEKFYHFCPRWKQLKFYDSFFESLIETAKDEKTRNTARQMLQANRSHYFNALKSAVKFEYKEKTSSLERSFMKYFILSFMKSPVLKIKNKLKSFISNK